MKRRTWFDFHSWVGLKLSVLMSFVLVTGTLATISYEIDWLANPAMRVYSSSALTPLDWPALFKQARIGFPDATLVNISAPRDPWFAVEVVALNAKGERFRIFLHPQSHIIQGTGRWNNWQRFFRDTHRHLMLPLNVGITIVGLMAIPLFISFATGFVVYRKWWRGYFKFPKEKERRGQMPVKGKRKFWGNLHRLLGVWCLWFIFLIAASGGWYLLEEWGLSANAAPIDSPTPQPAAGTELAVRKTLTTARVATTLTTARVATMATAVRSLYPELKVTRVQLPNYGGRHVSFLGNARAMLVRERANQVIFDAATGEHIATRKGEQLGIHMRISEAADPLHFGTFGNAPTRFIWFIFGVIMSGLSVSGVYLYGMRIVRSSAGKKTRVRSFWAASWRGIGRLRWPTISAVAVCLWIAVTVFVG